MSDFIDNLKLWDTDKLIPYDGNPKTHSQDQIEKLAGLIDRFGFTQPIVVDEDGVILIGHGRRLAAMYLGLESVPVLVREGLSETQKHAIRVSDNAIPLLGEIDEKMLTAELKRMMEAKDDFEISLEDMGLADFDVSNLIEEEPKSEPEPEIEDESQPDTDYSKPNLSREKDYTEVYQLIVDLEGEAQQEELYSKLTDQGYTCRPLTI